MQVVRLSESCIIFKELSTDPAPIANSLNQTPPPGLIEAVPAFDQLALYFDPDIFNLNSPESPLSVSMERACPGLDPGGIGGEVLFSNHSSDGESCLQTLFGNFGGGTQANTKSETESAPPPPLGEDLGGGNQKSHPTIGIVNPSPDEEGLPRTRSGGKGWGDQPWVSPDLESDPPPPLGEDLGGGNQKSHPTIGIVNPSPDEESLPRTRSGGQGWGDQEHNNLDAGENTLLKIIPALYNGPDIEAVANTLNLTIEELIRIHSQNIYIVEAIGFCPGFPYLSGLPQPLQNLPRKSTPRTAVEPGSIGITSDQCCIYPLVRPGGWNLIAQTPLTLVDPDSNYFPLQVGDKIQFQPITNSQFQQLKNKRL